MPIGTGGTSITISGSHLPGDGYQRAYYFQARDANGNWGPWNQPGYARVDHYSPQVSATNASSQWLAAQTATVSADDSVGGAAANSGLAEVRYRWNTPLGGGCTGGSVTTNGAVLTAPEGDDTLYLCARDLAGRVTTWSGSYRVDTSLPTLDSLTVSSTFWSIGDASTYQIIARASDSGSGVRDLKAMINLLGDNAANPRGNFSWQDQSVGYLWSGDQVPCTGGGFASKRPDTFNPETVTLVGCSTTLVGNQRTVTFTVRPESSFGEFMAVNDVAFWAEDFRFNARGWQNYDLNFASGSRPPASLQVLDDHGVPLAHSDTVSWGDLDAGSGGGQNAKTLTVKNNAAAGSSNLVLEGSPSNVEITGSSAFSIVGTLTSPLAVGQQDGFDVRLDTNQPGALSAQLKIWHNDPYRPNPLRINLSANVLAEPVVTGTTPDVIFQGNATTVTVTGENLAGATIYVATGAYEDGTPTGRVYPTADLVSINSAGTQLRATIHAEGVGVEGFYNLAIETPGGATGAPFRVVTPAPVVDVFTPSQAVQGQIHVLTVTGVNLAGANIVPSSPDVKVLDVDNSDDRSLMGLIYVTSGAPVGGTDIRIEGPGGSARIPLDIENDLSQVTLQTRKVRIPGKSDRPDVPDVLLQEPVSLAQLQRAAPGGTGEPGAASATSGSGLEATRGGGTPSRAAEAGGARDKFTFCFTYTYRVRASFSAILLSLSDQFGNPLTQQVLDNLTPGTHLNFNSLTVAVSGYLEIVFQFQICNDFVTDVIFCFRGGIAFMVPLVGGQSFTFDICAGNGGTSVALAANGFITNHTWSSSSSCVSVADSDPSSESGARAGSIDVNCCGQATVSLNTSGEVFETPFDVGGEVATISPYCPAQNSNTFLVVLRAYIPVNYAASPSPLDICREQVVPGTFVDHNLIFSGDERGPEANPDPKNLSPLFPKDYRIHQEIQLIPDQSLSAAGYLSGSHFAEAGATLAYADPSIADGRLGLEDWDWPNTDDCYKFHQWAVATLTKSFTVERLSSEKVKAHFVMAGNNPLSLFSPDIDWDIEVTLEKVNPSLVAWAVHAKHDCMPAYEVFINDQLVYSFLPDGSNGTTIPASQFLYCLPAPLDVDRVESGVFQY